MFTEVFLLLRGTEVGRKDESLEEGRDRKKMCLRSTEGIKWVAVGDRLGEESWVPPRT